MGIIDEGLEFLAGQAEKASQPHQIAVGDPRKSTYVIGGEVREVEASPAPRNHTLGHFDEVAKVANRFAGDDEGCMPVVWVGPASAVVVIDDDGHRVEKATLPLAESAAFKRLKELRSAPANAWMDQKAFVRLLRIDLAGTLEPGALLNAVRAIRWTSDTNVRIGRGQESMGAEIMARCTDGKELPEEVVIRLPVYITQGVAKLAKPIACSVEVEPSENKLRLLPLPNEIERAQQDTLDEMAGAIAAAIEGDTPVYLGQP